ncbi:sugar phosphate isomerase/epimerase [Streptomyces olivaceus]|uniref:sugar phosphate isomerase/epimerase family protein n=1 Tax=Streptomyces olivaceus TaxID=47716 RepID=UPI001CCAADC5|nr:sugar phosphate isomerase/epimerase family protein [Streptomyces olivaceus]MBZ6142260.1 sugar phosphate isomerase/epimerase [Streptomyces olivaceus]MBZ6170031.1 sugar phosphate isomerase/epimerase [Streptomyces olivaceus]MBZ6176438.1 sugar phosphate isomerase/epimerase [Streptomyces olivaceus]MBZ6183494.1 sugar phosphate isomerase/epimerase [Streptomyces olivaceus]
MNGRAFSTLGCPCSDLDEVISLARSGPCDGVELRCSEGQLLYPQMSDAEADTVAARLARAGLEPVCLASYVQVAADRPGVAEELAGHLRLAARLGAPAVRVFGGGAERPEGRRERAVRRLAEAAPLAARSGVALLLETHDEFLTGAAVAGVLAAVGSPAVGAVWDAVNPWRAGEPPALTAAVLGPWVRHVQLKDVASPADLRPVLPGEGVLPLADVLAELRRLEYRGWVSLEWERAWYPDVPGLDTALDAFHRVLDALAGPPPPPPAP